MRVYVENLKLLSGSSVAVGIGRDANGVPLSFGGDHRAMRDIGEALAATGQPVAAEVDDWQLLSGGGN